MKTLKIKGETHIRLTLFKNLFEKKSYDQAINDLLDTFVQYADEYGELTDGQRKLLEND